jgi:hypothetical protein
VFDSSEFNEESAARLKVSIQEHLGVVGSDQLKLKTFIRTVTEEEGLEDEKDLPVLILSALVTFLREKPLTSDDEAKNSLAIIVELHETHKLSKMTVGQLKSHLRNRPGAKS